VIRGKGASSDVGRNQFPFLEIAFHFSKDFTALGFTYLDVFGALYLLIDSYTAANLLDVVIVLLEGDFVGHTGFQDLFHLRIGSGFL
jgi:hypothetical protein